MRRPGGYIHHRKGYVSRHSIWDRYSKRIINQSMGIVQIIKPNPPGPVPIWNARPVLYRQPVLSAVDSDSPAQAHRLVYCNNSREIIPSGAGFGGPA